MKILTISDSPNLCSGLARVHRHVIDGLVEAGHNVLPGCWFGYDIETLIQIKTKKIQPPIIKYKDIKCAYVPKNENGKEVAVIEDLINNAKPDIVFTIGDAWNFYYMSTLIQQHGFNFRWIAYLTIEHEIPKSQIDVLRKADILISPTKYGQEVLSKSGLESHYIPYGVEKSFYQVDKKMIREQKGYNLDETRFITVAQNTPRKNLPALLQGIRYYLDHASNMYYCGKIKFFIHTNLYAKKNEANYFDLEKIVKDLRLEKYIQFSSTSIFEGETEDYLREEYSAADYFISSAITEGFGLPIIESMACGCIPIVNNFHVFNELAGNGRGFFIQGEPEYMPPDRLLSIPKRIGIAESIDFALRNQENFKFMQENAIKFANELTWEKCKERIAGILKGIKRNAVIPVELLT